jgi:hypothetical protein
MTKMAGFGAKALSDTPAEDGPLSILLLTSKQRTSHRLTPCQNDRD